MAVIGTAGHVDHGKSTLVQALTGRDPDRWAEEKARGLTIDLGFAWTEIEPGVAVSFVDVPGHERFIKNMLAGIESVDIGLLVVAADEGWKPQTEEHVAVLDLLGVAAGVVALTKVDRVDSDVEELARLEVAERLEGTSLEHAEIVAVSATEGTGLPALRTELARLVGGLPLQPAGGPRLWIDRAFTIVGAGTVVTGTLTDGPVEIEDRLTLLPAGRELRVRAVQTHEQSVTRAEPRRRVALNLSGVERSEIERGAMLAPPGTFVTSSRFTARVRAARYVDELTDRGAYHLHVGSGAWPARLRMLAPDIGLIQTTDALPLRFGDRFVLRESGRRLVVGGGSVLDLRPPAKGRAALKLGRQLVGVDDPDLIAEILVAARGRYPVNELAAETGGGSPRDTVVDGIAFAPDEIDRLGKRAEAAVDRFHSANPLRPGIPAARLASELGVTLAILGHIVSTVGLSMEGATVAKAGRASDLTERQTAEWDRAREMLAARGYADLPKVIELGLDQEIVHRLTRDGRLVRVSADFVYLPEQIEEIITLMRGLEQPFTVSAFKDATGMSRKYAVPFLEWTDHRGATVRSGDVRRFRENG